MRRLPLVLVAVALLAVPAKAHAATTRCSGHRYGLISSHAFPAIRRLRAHGLPRRTDGYAPRCLVAEAVAGLGQSRWGRTTRPCRRRPGCIPGARAGTAASGACATAWSPARS